MKKKLMKKKSESKQKSNYLNFTNPIKNQVITQTNKQVPINKTPSTVTSNVPNNIPQNSTSTSINNSNFKLNVTK